MRPAEPGKCQQKGVVPAARMCVACESAWPIEPCSIGG